MKINKKVENKFLFKNKKAEMDELIRNIMWIILFVILLVGVGFLLRKILA